mgnify:FL=1
MSRFLNPFYVVNTSVLLTFFLYFYPPLRNSSNTSLHNHTGFIPIEGCSQELELVGVLFFSFCSKYRRCSTADEVVQKAIFHTKLLSLLLIWFISHQKTYWLLAVYVGMYFVVKPGKYRGPEEVTYFNSMTFETRVRNVPSDSPDRKTVWIVAFWADWCETCQVLEAMYCQLSCRFSGAQRKFGRVDVVRFPEVAEQFRIDTSGTSWQLPTIILFYKGKEIKRLPPFKSDGTVVKTTLDEKGVIKYFEMDKVVENCSWRKKKSKKDPSPESTSASATDSESTSKKNK